MVFTAVTLKVLTHTRCGWRCVTTEAICHCKNCDRFITNTEMSLVNLPNPFMANAPRCILLKPSYGGFNEYKVGDDLHIGISNSESMVYSYWKDGIVAEFSGWKNAISIYDFEEACFDDTLQRFIDENATHFSREKYTANNWNCFDFVILFLKFADVVDEDRSTKDCFVADFIEAPLQRAIRYCRLVERLKRAQHHQLPLSPDKSNWI
ncbi:hypothetical protein Tcan_05503 [Toxocara canis]|uniref:MKRN2 opposite strand protein-like C-terminal domain-containing protein n=1 Tax=Toxocara canis TaxID=6265 RepID=A0A0B2VBK4_TOXCA|nr:hypothetical protein Tcan_05503 [Toxocara canis]